MPKRIINFFSQESGGLNNAAAVLALSAIFSGVLALFRDRLLAGSFGAGRMLDIYYTAFRIPDILYVISIFVASNTVIIPIFYKKFSSSEKEAKVFFDGMFTVFCYLMFVLIIISFFLAPWIMNFLVPGFSEADKAMVVGLTRLMLLSPLLLGLSNLISIVVQSFNRFYLYALSPVFYNIGIIFGIVFLRPIWGLGGVVAGVILGALLHLIIQIPFIRKSGFESSFVGFGKINFSEIKNVVWLSMPRALALSLDQLILIFVTFFASGLSVGSIAIFKLSYGLQAVPVTVIGVSYSVAAFPILARLFLNNKREEFLSRVGSAIRQIFFWMVPVSFLIIVLRAQIVRVLFGYGEFGWRDTRLTAASLALFAVSLAAQSMILLFVRAFYAAGRTLKPFMSNAVSTVGIVGLSYLFLRMEIFYPSFKKTLDVILRTQDIRGAEMLVFPLAVSIGMIFNVVWLAWLFKKEFGFIGLGKKTFIQSITASLMMSATAYYCLNVLDQFFNIQTFVGILAQGAVSAVAGGIVWFVILKYWGSNELEEMISSFRQKFWKTPVIAGEAKDVELS